MKCQNCNSMIADDSIFCPYCGRRIERTSPFDVSYTGARRAKRRFTDNKPLKVVAAIFAVIIALVIIEAALDDIANSDLTPVTEPESGEIFYGEEVADYYLGDDRHTMYPFPEIAVTASNSESCVVKLKTPSGSTYISFYVRAGDTVNIRVPLDEYYVYFASGETWYGEDYMFGEYTDYFKDSTITDFSEGSWEYKLNRVSGGNFSEEPIDEDEF